MVIRFIGKRPEMERYAVVYHKGRENIIRFEMPIPYNNGRRYSLYLGDIDVTDGFDYSNTGYIHMPVTVKRNGTTIWTSEPLWVDVVREEDDKLSEEMVPTTDQPHMQLVTDANGEKKWVERTHYDSVGNVYVVAPGSYEHGAAAYDELKFEINADPALTVEYDGELYANVVLNWIYDAGAMYGFYGNGSLVKNSFYDNGMPFCIEVNNWREHGRIYFSDQGTHQLAAYYEGMVPTPLDEKYLPSTVPVVEAPYAEYGYVITVIETDDDEKPKKWGVKEGMPIPGTAHQQLVTNADGKAVWEERYGYKETTETVILPETTGVIENDGEYARFDIALNMSVQAGDVVLVNYNGETYECTAYNDYDSMRLGATDLVKYPFFVTLFSEDFNSGKFDVSPDTNPTGTEITLSLTKKETIIKPIPAEYLPSPYDVIFDIEFGEQGERDVATLDNLTIVKGSYESCYAVQSARFPVKALCRLNWWYGWDWCLCMECNRMKYDRTPGDDYVNEYMEFVFEDTTFGATITIRLNQDGTVSFTDTYGS